MIFLFEIFLVSYDLLLNFKTVLIFIGKLFKKFGFLFLYKLFPSFLLLLFKLSNLSLYNSKTLLVSKLIFESSSSLSSSSSSVTLLLVSLLNSFFPKIL